MKLVTDIADGRPTVPAPAPLVSGGLAPRAPLELSGRRRDDARLLVARSAAGTVTETRMAHLDHQLEPGDVLVVNTSATLPAALVVDSDLIVHLSTVQSRELAVVELRQRAGHGSLPWSGEPVRHLAVPDGGVIELGEPYSPQGRPPVPAPGTTWPRLWTARLELPGGIRDYLARHGRPIRYGADARPWPLSAYQTVFATEPGSAEMPSAGRAFTPELVTRLVSKGIVVTPILLHTGVASQEAGEPPYPEWFRVPPATAAAVNGGRSSGHRVVAVGTTATRALESVAAADGTVAAGSGWTDLVIGPDRPLRAVDGLLTGWHDPEATHLQLVEAVAGREILDRSYSVAAAAGYAGHEFGDLHLVLP